MGEELLKNNWEKKVRLDTLGLGISGVTETDSVPEKSSDPNDKHIK